MSKTFLSFCFCALAGTCFFFAGCDSAKDALSEMTGGSDGEEKKEEVTSAYDAAPADTGKTQPVIPPKPPENTGPAKKTPEQVVAAFMKKQEKGNSVQIVDQDLKELTELGEQHLAGITGIRLSAASKLTGEGVACLGKIPNLIELEMMSVAIVGPAFQGLSECKKLQRLWLNKSRGFDDSAMQFVASLPELQSLDVSGTTITDTGVAMLQKCKSLRELNVADNNKINGSGFKTLRSSKLELLNVAHTSFGSAGMPFLSPHKSSLVVLNVSQCGLQDQFMQHMKGMRNLKDFALGFNGGVTDIGMKKLGGYPSLEHLHMAQMNVTGRSLLWVASCKNLVELNIDRTKVAQLAVEQLHNKLKNCTILYQNQRIPPASKE